MKKESENYSVLPMKHKLEEIKYWKEMEFMSEKSAWRLFLKWFRISVSYIEEILYSSLS